MDLRRAAVFLWIRPFEAARSSLENMVFILSFASLVFPEAIRERKLLSSFLSSDFILELCKFLVLSTRNLLAAHFLCGIVVAPFVREDFISYKGDIVNMKDKGSHV